MMIKICVKQLKNNLRTRTARHAVREDLTCGDEGAARARQRAHGDAQPLTSRHAALTLCGPRI
jgi:hypothetical protein